jgi:cbb3-type cytochrome oxidase maturation protein
MDGMFFLIPITIVMGLGGLWALMWSLKARQYEDPDGAAHRILIDDGDLPLP